MGTDMDSKICTRCNENKLLSEYYARGPKKLRSECKTCCSKDSKKKYLRDPEGNRQRTRQYTKENPEKAKESQKKSCKKHADKRKAYQEEYCQKNADRMKERDAKTYQKNRDKRLLQMRSWKESNIEWTRAYSKSVRATEEGRMKINSRKKVRYESDPIYRLACLIRNGIRQAFDSIHKPKKSKTAQILCCSFEELYSHLVLSAMNNYGLYLDSLDYEIDHIIPIATAKTEEDVIRLNHYTNLQFLYPEDNGAKSDSLTWMDDFRRMRAVLLNPIDDKMTITAEQAKDVRC